MTESRKFIPPMINGVSASKVFLPRLNILPKCLFDYLCEEFQHIQASEWKQRFEDKLIYNEHGEQLTIDSAYLPDSVVFYYRFLAHEVHVPFEHHIIFENDHLLVVDKPHFLTISPTGQYVQETLLVRLKQQTNNPNLTPIHRLDRETAGIVLFSKKVISRGVYQQMFASRDVKKIYHAIAPFNAKLHFPQHVALRMEKGQPFYIMQVVDGSANSETDIHLLQHDQTWAKYELYPKTGKQHQLRVHLNFLGLAIKNDPFYPMVQHKPEDDFSAPLQLLAKHLSFIDPITGQKMQFNSNFELIL